MSKRKNCSIFLQTLLALFSHKDKKNGPSRFFLLFTHSEHDQSFSDVVVLNKN